MSDATSTAVSKVVTLTVIGANGGVAINGDTVLTSMGLEELVFIGLTYGAWVKVVLFLSLLIVVILNLKKLWVEILVPIWSVFRSKKDNPK